MAKMQESNGKGDAKGKKDGVVKKTRRTDPRKRTARHAAYAAGFKIISLAVMIGKLYSPFPSLSYLDLIRELTKRNQSQRILWPRQCRRCPRRPGLRDCRPRRRRGWSLLPRILVRV
jgi:hypothetical protein